jgi:lysozyme family protein
VKIEQALAILLKHEGGYSDHPSDPGGATMYGITQRVARQHGYMGHMRDLPLSTATEIYRKSYWMPIRADELPDAMRFHVFDAAVNSGPGQAIKWLQECANVKSDGVIGPITIKAAASASPARYNAIRLRLMTSLPTWAAFGKGWARRIADNLDLI